MPPHSESLSGVIDTPELLLSWKEAPWDSIVFHFLAVQIDRLEYRSFKGETLFKEFTSILNQVDCGFISCRLSHDKLKESMLLEDFGFRFIEMLYQPLFNNLENSSFLDDEQNLHVSIASQADIPEIIKIAGLAYGNERFHMDPRLPSVLGDIRYQNWIKNTITHPSQKLYSVKDGDKLVSFFITEDIGDSQCYWHLNAVNPIYQGQGYGRRSWRKMLNFARQSGFISVKTCIAARNHRVLNLYAQLGFSFPPPLMTFHWVAPGKFSPPVQSVNTISDSL